MTRAFVGFLVGLSLHASGLAQTDYRVFVRMNLRVTVTYPAPPPSLPDHWERHRFYARGGLLLSTLVQRNTQSVSNVLLRGTPGDVFLSQLKSALNDNRIGRQESCWTDADPRFAGEEEIIWNGRGGREHRFVVTFSQVAVAGLPRCSEETENIRAALIYYEERTQERGELIVYSD